MKKELWAVLIEQKQRIDELEKLIKEHKQYKIKTKNFTTVDQILWETIDE